MSSLFLAGPIISLLSICSAADQPTPALLANIKSGRATFDQVLPWLDTEEPELRRLLFESEPPRVGPGSRKTIRDVAYRSQIQRRARATAHRTLADLCSPG